jgi:hypothetical protein
MLNKVFKLAACAAMVASALPAAAQIGIEVSLNRSTYMLYEPVYACVSLRNDTGRPLLFGSNPRFQGFILFDIRDRDGRPIPQRPDTGISVTGLMLRPGEIKRMVIPINKYYDLDDTGRYTVRVFISHNMLPAEYQSRDVSFRIERGVDVWTRTVGMANIDGENADAPHRTRTYTIRIMTESPNKYYYLVVEDERHVYGVMRVGRVFNAEHFSAEVDMLSRIHLLMPLSSKVFHYLSFSIEGENVNNSYWKVTNTIPMLYRDPTSGIVTRMGGAEARKGVDFKDPNQGKMTLAQMMTADELREAENTPPPPPPRNPGKVDLGRSMEIDADKLKN